MSREIRCVVFDFDGVLIDSNGAKRRSYFDIFEGSGVQDEVVARCLADHPDGDRREVITAIVAACFPGDAAETLVARYLDAYAANCDNRIPQCAEQQGAATILAWAATCRALYLNSATPIDALERYISNRGWRQYFRGVLGRPHTKAENFDRIRTIEQIDSDAILFIGDHQSDAIAARVARCHFVGVRSDTSDFDPGVNLLQSLDALPQYIARLENSAC